jgi:hypothetical protein
VTEMDRDVAHFVAASASRAAQELSSLIPFLKEYGEGEKDDALRHAIASAIYEIGSVRQAAFEQHLDLNAEFEQRLKKYGRLAY